MAPWTDPHTIVASKFMPQGSSAAMMGFFCLRPVMFSPPA